MFDIDFVVCSRQAKTRGCLQRIAAGGVQFRDEGLQIDAHAWATSGTHGNTASRASSVDSCDFNQLIHPRRGASGPSSVSSHSGTSAAFNTTWSSKSSVWPTKKRTHSTIDRNALPSGRNAMNRETD